MSVMTHTSIQFTHKKKQYSWSFSHNLEINGLSIAHAFESYAARLGSNEKPNQSKFCKYVVSKDPDSIRCEIVSA